MRQDRTRLYGAVAAAVLVAAGGGYGVARLTMPAPAGVAAAEPAKVEPAAAATLEMPAERIAASGVTLEAVSVGGLASEVLAQASVVAEPMGQAVLTAKAAGAVSRINKRLGDPVHAGEVLALVESREAAQIAATRGAAAAKADLARKVYAREQRLFEARVSPRQDLEAAQAELAAAEAEARGAAVAAGAADVSRDGRYVMVVSPISGRITAAAASLGAFVQPETELFRIADPSRIQVEAAVSATDAQHIQVGDTAVIEAGAGVSRIARVRSVTPSLDVETRAATVVLVLTGEGPALQPGQIAHARITARQTAASGIVVPDEAVQTLEGSDAVFVRTAGGFRVQRVTVGRRAAGRAEIRAGLKSGDVIAARNAFLVKAELGKGSEEDE